MNIEELYRLFVRSDGISTDTRTLRKNQLFFALKGERFDAGEFVDDALNKGATAVVTERKNQKGDNIIPVDDSLKTLQQLATFHRQKLGLPVIAITGSNGKTTTKELLAAVLSKKYKTAYTKGNLNNHIGVPLTLLDISRDTQIAIVEMGANHPGEIDTLCRIAMPDYGYITNFGKAHLEGFGSEEGVIRAKTELYRYLSETDGTVFVNSDPRQKELTLHQKNIPLTTRLSLVKTHPYVWVKHGDTLIKSHLVGAYNFDNISAAIGIGKHFRIPVEDIREAIESYVPGNKRSQLIRKRNVNIILDAYNANPTSMKVALESFERYPSAKKAVILGDMLELGAAAAAEHRNIAQFATAHFDKAVFIGPLFHGTQTPGSTCYPSYDDFLKNFNAGEWNGYHILIKASRGMALERIVELFE